MLNMVFWVVVTQMYALSKLTEQTIEDPCILVCIKCIAVYISKIKQ